MALNALLGGKGNGGGNSNALSGLANQFLGGGHGSSNHHGGGGGGMGGKLVGKLASNLLSSSDKPAQPQNYHGGQSSGHQQNHGLAGSLMGGVASMFGGKPANDAVRGSIPRRGRGSVLTHAIAGTELRLFEFGISRRRLFRPGTDLQPTWKQLRVDSV